LFEIELEINKINEKFERFIPTKLIDTRKKPEKITNAKILKTGSVDLEKIAGGYMNENIKKSYKTFFIQGLHGLNNN